MKYSDYYGILGVARDASLDEIKKAYRKLARKHHPDLSKAADAQKRFAEVGEAYATLKDAAKRAAYDELDAGPQGESFAPPPGRRARHGTGGAALDDFDLSDLFAAMGRGAPAREPRPVQGQDYENTVLVSVEEAHRGTTRRLKLVDAMGEHVLEVTIPAATVDGQKLRLRGKGGKGRGGGADGDIYVEVRFAKHLTFRPDGHDLYFDLPLQPWEAVLGAEKIVGTLEGEVLLTVPPATRTGRKLRIRGRGLHAKNGARGDLYAMTRIDIPAQPTEAERALYRQISALSLAPEREGAAASAAAERA